MTTVSRPSSTNSDRASQTALFRSSILGDVRRAAREKGAALEGKEIVLEERDKAENTSFAADKVIKGNDSLSRNLSLLGSFSSSFSSSFCSQDASICFVDDDYHTSPHSSKTDDDGREDKSNDISDFHADDYDDDDSEQEYPIGQTPMPRKKQPVQRDLGGSFQSLFHFMQESFSKSPRKKIISIPKHGKNGLLGGGHDDETDSFDFSFPSFGFGGGDHDDREEEENEVELSSSSSTEEVEIHFVNQD